MNLIKNWITGALSVLDDFAEQRVQRTRHCPECEHPIVPLGGEPAVADCGCDWPACPCAYEEEESRG